MPRETSRFWSRHAVRKGKPVVHIHFREQEIGVLSSEEARIFAVEIVNDADEAEELANLHPGEDVAPKESKHGTGD